MSDREVRGLILSKMAGIIDAATDVKYSPAHSIAAALAIGGSIATELHTIANSLEELADVAQVNVRKGL